MSDLISRKALIKAMEKKYDIANETGMYPTGLSEAFIITEKIIREQPTAYDVDKVVKDLKDHSYKSREWNPETQSFDMPVIELDLAIRLMKGAVKE
jgi:hypothetical protein